MKPKTCIAASLTALVLASSIGASALFASSPMTRSKNSNSQASYHFGYVDDPPPAFPRSLIERGITQGYAIIVVPVRDDGLLEDWIALEASDRFFIPEIERVIWDWWFDFPQVDGQSRSVTKRMRLEFKAVWQENRQRYLGAPNIRLLSNRHLFGPTASAQHTRSDPYRIASIYELDQPPRPIFQAPIKVHPDLLPDRTVEAFFHFYLDETGRVRMPALYRVEGRVEDDALAIVQEALQQWTFTPPTVDGKPVTIEVEFPVKLSRP